MLTQKKQVSPQPVSAVITSAVKKTAIALAIISSAVNILALTSPVFMLQVYDRVLTSGSIPTLVGLSILAIVLFLFQALLDIIRSRILLRIAEHMDHKLSGQMFDAVTRLPLISRQNGDGLQPLRDLENLRSFLASQGPAALFDLPWIPLYLAICFLFHFWIGMTALIGATVLMMLTICANHLSKRPVQDVLNHNMMRSNLLESSRSNAEVIAALGMGQRLQARWSEASQAYLAASCTAGDLTNGLTILSKTLRVMLQSAILATGAWLVVGQEVTGGIMIASSVMVGRALAPIDQVTASWKPMLMARLSWKRLNDLLAAMPASMETLTLPAPEKSLAVETLVIIPPGEKKPTVSGVRFSLQAGSALGVIGPSGAGKSTLARALVRAWIPVSGKIKLDGASLDQWETAALGAHIGYLPQLSDLFEGTVADNIARFDLDAKSEDIIEAAKEAGVHDLILSMAEGYQTHIGERGSKLSAGQRQRIALARALYKKPFLVVMDEPNANLDADGEANLINAIYHIRKRGGIAVIFAHRPSVITAVDHILMLEAGKQKAFGERDHVLQDVLKAGYPSRVPAKTTPEQRADKHSSPAQQA